MQVGKGFAGIMPAVTPAGARILGAVFVRLAAAIACGSAGCAHEAASTPAKAPSAVPKPQRYVSSYAYAWFIRAELARARGDLRGAIQGYRATLADAEIDPYVLARLATALDESGDDAGAEQALREAFELDAMSEAAWLARARIAERHGREDVAIEAYERAEVAAPISSTAPLSLAQLLRSRGDDERAIAVLERYEARTLPGSIGATRARLARALARRDAQGAYDAAQSLLRSENGAEPMLIRTAHELLATGQAPLALRLLQALPVRESDARLRFDVFVACGQLDSAEVLLTQSTPEAFGGLFAFAQAYASLGRFEQALQLATLARTRDPDDARARALELQLDLELAGLPALAREVAERAR